MFKWKLCKNGIRQHLRKILVTIQLLLLTIEITSITLLTQFMLYPNSFYKDYLPGIKKTLLQTYKSNDYDFMSTSVKETMSFTVNRISNKVFEKNIEHYAVLFDATIAANILVTFLSLGYARGVSIRFISGVLSLGMGIYFFYRFIFINYSIKKILYQILNNTHSYSEDYKHCVICYRTMHSKFNEDIQHMNVLALALHAFKCCGIKSYKDVMHNGNIPYTCCPRKSYKYSIVKQSVPCERKSLYPPCMNKLSPYINWAFVKIKVLICFLWIFNLSYAMFLLIFIFNKETIKPKHKAPNFGTYSISPKSTIDLLTDSSIQLKTKSDSPIIKKIKAVDIQLMTINLTTSSISSNDTRVSSQFDSTNTST